MKEMELSYSRLKRGAANQESQSPFMTVSILSAASLVCYMDRQLLAVLAEPIKLDLGLSDTTIGLVSGLAFALFYAAFGVPMARLADRWSRKILLTGAVAFWTLSSMLCGMASNLVQLLMARIGVAAAEGGCVPTAHAIIGDQIVPRYRTLSISVFHAAGSVGLFVGSAAGGWLAKQYGWRTAFVYVSFPGLFVALLVWLMLDDTKPTTAGVAQTSDNKGLGALAALKILLRRSVLLNIGIGYAISSFGIQAIGQWSSAFLIRSHGLDLTQVGLWNGVANGIGSLAGLLIGGWLATILVIRDRRWELWLPALANLIAAPLFVIALWMPNAVLTITCFLAATLSWAIGMAPGLGAIQSITESGLKATAVACVVLFAAILGQGCGPFFTGVLSDILQPSNGSGSLRISLTIACNAFVWSSLHFLYASKYFVRQLISD